MMLLTSAMRPWSLYQGFGVGLTRGGRLRAQALPHSCRIMSKHIQLRENRLAAGDQSVSQTWQGACPAAPPPCCLRSSATAMAGAPPRPPSPCSTFGRRRWVAGYFPLPYCPRELEASADYPTGHKGLRLGTLDPRTRCFAAVQFVPNQGPAPRPLLWAFAIPESVDTFSDLRARGSVLQLEDWQLFSCKENDWLYLFLIHCYLVHMHNSCLILVVISRKYCLSLSQWNSLSRCPLKKKIWIWKKLKISPKGKRWEITRAVS